MARSTARADPQWPSLEGQLSALGTRQGSALERLVKDKIRTSGLLRPEEANDDLGLPLWLRVHVRKADYDERRAVARLLVSKSDDAHSSEFDPAAGRQRAWQSRSGHPISRHLAAAGIHAWLGKTGRVPDGKIALSARRHAAISLD